MSISDAMKLFGLNEVPDNKEELNKHFKKLALKHHPDLGGSEETMKLLNQAKELLDKNLGKTFTSYSSHAMSPSEKKAWQEEKEKQMTYIKNLVEQTLAKFDVEVYKKYLEDAFKISFTATKKLDYWMDSRRRLQMEFSDEERDKVFHLTFDIDEWNLRRQIFDEKSGLGSSDKTIKISIQSFVYIDGKKQVLVKERYYTSDDAKIFTDPTILLPKTRISKFVKGEARKNSKLAKRDFEAMFEAKFNGDRSSSGPQMWYYIPVHDEYVVVLWRTTFLRIGQYTLYAIGKPMDKNKKYYFGNYQRWMDEKDLRAKYSGYGSSTFVIENQKGFDFLKTALTEFNKTGNVDKFVKSFVEIGNDKSKYED